MAGGKMKSVTGWNPPNIGATNVSEFSGLPGGYRDYGSFTDIGKFGFWWSATQFDTDAAWSRYLTNTSSSFSRIVYSKEQGFSCRCVKD